MKRKPAENLKLELKSCYNTDLLLQNIQLSDWRPTELADVNVFVTLEIGIEGEAASDFFHLWIATPQALQGKGNNLKTGRLLVVQQYNWLEIKRTIEGWVSECERATWIECTDCLRKYFHWEYEGMA